MAQTDVNTAFYGILAPTRMSEYFMLQNVSTDLLFCEGVNGLDHLRHVPDVSSGPGHGPKTSTVLHSSLSPPHPLGHTSDA